VELEGDIIVQSFRGLGRGRGFEVASRASILTENETTRLIADRTLDIIHLLLHHAILDRETVRSRLNLSQAVTRRVAEDDDGGDTVNDILEMVEVVLPEYLEWDTAIEYGDSVGAVLKERVQHLIAEYKAFQALNGATRRNG
jgi:hypothetical protein